MIIIISLNDTIAIRYITPGLFCQAEYACKRRQGPQSKLPIVAKAAKN